jgi:hypothetical protein
VSLVSNDLGSTSTSQLPVSGLLQELHALANEFGVGLSAVVDPETETAHLSFAELATDELRPLVIEGRPWLHEGDLELGLARMTDGHPPKAVEGHVGPCLEAEHVDVEVASGVLIEAVDGREGDVRDHASTVGESSFELLLPDCSIGLRPHMNR